MLERPVSAPRSRDKGLLESKRVRLVVSLAVYGGAMGGASLLVNFLSRTRFPQEPEHLSFTTSFFLAGGAGLISGLLAAAMVYWACGDATRARGPLIWAALGFGFGVLSPFVTGAMLPFSTALLNAAVGVTPSGQLPAQVLDAIFRAPAFAFSHGVLGLFTGLLAGAIFGAGAWLIDVTNASTRPSIPAFAPYAIALGLSVIFVVIAAYGPTSVLAKLG